MSHMRVDGRLFKALVAWLAKAVPECNFSRAEDGVEIKTLDGSRTAAVWIRGFDSDLLGNADTCGIDFGVIKKVLKSVRSDDTVWFGVVQRNNKLLWKVAVVDPDGKETRRWFFPVLDIPREDVELRDLDLNVSFEAMPPKGLIDVLKDAIAVAADDESVVFEYRDGKLLIHVESVMAGIEYEAEIQDEDWLVDLSGKDARVALSASMINVFVIPILKNTDGAKVCFGTDLPVRFNTNLQQLEVTVFIAPRIER